MPGHRRDQQDLAVTDFAAWNGEVNQIANRFGQNGFNFNQMIFAILGLNKVQPPAGLYDHA
jgi:hypothetical protein|tara:strand:+ start:5284 stop:5466 length:183 start_codon:yes stop_codon:yes gene_type:complete